MGDVAEAAGVSRQALYLHFPDRAGLVVAAAEFGDELLDVDEAARPVREATTGAEMLDRLAVFFGDYLPRVADVATALEALRSETDDVGAALADRARSRYDGARAIAARLRAEGTLHPDLSPDDAAGLILALGSVHVWAELTRDRGWSKKRYVEHMKRLLRLSLLAPVTAQKRVNRRTARRGSSSSRRARSSP